MQTSVRALQFEPQIGRGSHCRDRIRTINLFNTINAKVSTAESSPFHNYAGDQGGREFFKPLGNLLAKRHLDPKFLGTIVHPLTQEEGRLLKKKSGKKIAPRSRCCRRAIFSLSIFISREVWAQNNALWSSLESPTIQVAPCLGCQYVCLPPLVCWTLIALTVQVDVSKLDPPATWSWQQVLFRESSLIAYVELQVGPFMS